MGICRPSSWPRQGWIPAIRRRSRSSSNTTDDGAARGRVVDEPALVDALARRQIRGAALDVMVEEPLPAASPLWAMEHVLITPHTAGETCRYEDNVLAIMQENLARLWRGETELLNQVV
jgi:D-2-hydroxyacid dehydrogenase (NADP+)